MSQKTIAKGYRALLIPDERLTPNSEVTSGATTASESGPRPGQAIPQVSGVEAIISTSNEQGEAVQTVYCTRGGFATAGEYGWKTSADGLTSDIRGCNYPNFAGDVRHIGGGVSSLTSAGKVTCITAKSGRVIWAFAQYTGTIGKDVACIAYTDDMITIVGADLSVPVISEDPLSDQYYGVKLDNRDCVCLYWDSDRNIAQLFVRIEDSCTSGNIQYYLFESADEGETWELTQRDCLRPSYTPTYTARRPIVCKINGELMLLHSEDNSTNGAYAQFYSSDRGRNFYLLGADATTRFSYSAVEFDGRAIIASVDDASGNAVMTTLGSAYDVVENQTWTTIGDLTSCLDVCVVKQHGRIFVYATPVVPIAIYCRMSESTDPTTFVPAGHDCFTVESISANINFTNLCATDGFGAIILSYNVEGSTVEPNYDGHIFAHRMGGWSTVTLPALSPSTTGYIPGRVSFGPGNSATSGTIFDADRAVWFPWCAPDSILVRTWTAAGAGSDTAGLSAGDSPFRNIACTAGQARRFTQTFNEDMTQGILAYFDVRPNTGGSSTSNDQGLDLILSDGTTEYHLFVRVTRTGIYLHDDTSGTTSASLNNPVGNRRFFFVALRENDPGSAAIATLYKGKYDTIGGVYGMEELGSINLDPNTSTPSTDSSISFGCVGLAGAGLNADWFSVCYIASSGTVNIHDLALGNVISNIDRISGAPCSSYPVYTTDGLKIAFSGGPAKRGEYWEIAPKYDYSLDHVYPRLYPSPRQTWRSQADGADNIIAWEFDTVDELPQGLGSAIWGAAILNANFANWKLDGYTAAGSWENIITVDSSDEFTSLPYRAAVRAGLTAPYLTVNTSGSGSATRFIHENELAGGTVAVGSARFRILRNTSGYWSTSAGKKPVLFLESWDSSISSTGTLNIWPPNSLAVKQGLGSTEYVKLRIVVSSDTTADGYFEAGQVIVGPVYVFGHAYSKGRVLTRSANSVVNYTQGGASNPVKYGPSYRTVEFGWFEGLDQTDIYYLNDEPDYVTVGDATGVAYAAASRSDTPTNLDGLHGYLDGGNVPVVYIPNIPYDASEAQFTTTDGASINGFIYGRIVGDIKLSTVTGVEQLSEVAQIAAIQIREEK